MAEKIYLPGIQNLELREYLERFTSEPGVDEYLDLDRVALLDANRDAEFGKADQEILKLSDSLYAALTKFKKEHETELAKAFRANFRRYSSPSTKALEQFRGLDQHFDSLEPTQKRWAVFLQALSWLDWNPMGMFVDNPKNQDPEDPLGSYYGDLLPPARDDGIAERDVIAEAERLDPFLGYLTKELIFRSIDLAKIPSKRDEDKKPNPLWLQKEKEFYDLLNQMNEKILMPRNLGLYVDVIAPLGKALYLNFSLVPVEIVGTEIVTSSPNDSCEASRLVPVYHLKALNKNVEFSALGETDSRRYGLRGNRAMGLYGPKIFEDNLDETIQGIKMTFQKPQDQISRIDQLVVAEFSRPPYFQKGTYDWQAIRSAVEDSVKGHELQHDQNILSNHPIALQYSETSARLQELCHGPLPLYSLGQIFDYIKSTDVFFGSSHLTSSGITYRDELLLAVEILYAHLKGEPYVPKKYDSIPFEEKKEFIISAALSKQATHQSPLFPLLPEHYAQFFGNLPKRFN